MSSPAVLHNSSFSAPVEAGALTPVQVQVVASLAQGHTVTRAATAAGIHRTTIHNWVRDSTEFHTALEEARRQFTASVADQLNELSAVALRTLRALLESPDTPPAIRLRAALAVLGRPDDARAHGWQLPECVQLPKVPTPRDHGRAASPLPLPIAPPDPAGMLSRPD
jgi:transposase-like protein